MKLRTVGKLGVILSLILFCIGVIFYGFSRFSGIDNSKRINLLSLVPADCIGLLETDNLDFLSNELPQTAYGERFDSAYANGLGTIIFRNWGISPEENAHGVGNYMGRMMISFHHPAEEKDLVMYFTTELSGKALFSSFLKKKGIDFIPKEERYRGKKITIFPVRNGEFLSTYSGSGFVAVSYRKNLIEKVIDAEVEEYSLQNDTVFMKAYHHKGANFLTIYGRTASFPLLSEGHTHGWSEFDIHLNSEVFYLSGSMQVPDTCLSKVHTRLEQIAPIEEDSLLILPGRDRVDSCIARISTLLHHSIFDECVQNLSREASYIMVADMDKIIRHPEPYKEYLPVFIYNHVNLFRSFIFSLQVTEVEKGLSHICVFTYKE